MEAQAQKSQTATTASGIARIAGRIESTRSITTQTGQLRLTLLRLPAGDEYSTPSTVEIQHRQPIGVKGDGVMVTVRIGGRSRTYDGDDGMGGKHRVQTATNTLEVVEG